MEVEVHLVPVWTKRLNDYFTCVVVDEVFRPGTARVVVGDVNGKVWIIDDEQQVCIDYSAYISWGSVKPKSNVQIH